MSKGPERKETPVVLINGSETTSEQIIALSDELFSIKRRADSAETKLHITASTNRRLAQANTDLQTKVETLQHKIVDLETQLKQSASSGSELRVSLNAQIQTNRELTEVFAFALSILDSMSDPINPYSDIVEKVLKLIDERRTPKPDGLIEPSFTLEEILLKSVAVRRELLELRHQQTAKETPAIQPPTFRKRLSNLTALVRSNPISSWIFVKNI